MKLHQMPIDKKGIPSCVMQPELDTLKHLAATSNAKVAVDLGSGAGATVCAMSEGFAVRGQPFPVIHAYDWFCLGENHYAPEKFRAISDKSKPGFLNDFRHNTEPYRKHIVEHVGDIREHTWTGDPIDLIHVDCCKEIGIHNHVVAQFFPSLSPGAIVIQQDFLMPNFGTRRRLGWIKYTSGYLEPWIHFVGRVHCAAYFEVVETPPREAIEDVITNCAILFGNDKENKG